ncbi:hypothetical protein PG991_001483 [Apiospora marii]|uniref:Ankyrin n=1 Tax=Apiospora marii TaxID=335849 RepID=A0ABR1SS67_9PEZI
MPSTDRASDQVLSEDEAAYQCDFVGPDDPKQTFYHIIKSDDVAAFEAYLHSVHCFRNHRTIPYVFANSRDDEGMPWEVALKLGSVGVLEALLQYQAYDDGYYRHDGERDPSWREWPKPEWPHRLLLHRAIENGKLDVLRVLLTRPWADVHQLEEGLTPILTACYQFMYHPWGKAGPGASVDLWQDIITLLLDSGADGRNEAKEPVSDLDENAVEGEEEISRRGTSPTPLIRRLVQEGADVNARISYWCGGETRGTTLFHIASRSHNVAAVHYLLERPDGPALARSRDSAGRLPLPFAAIGWFPNHRLKLGLARDAEITPQTIATIQALLPYNGVDERGTRGLTALALASRYSEKGTVTAVVAAGHDDTAYYDPVVQFLLDHGADPDGASDGDGDTPLHAAVSAGRTGAMRILLRHGAKADMANQKSDTPVHTAAGMYRHKGEGAVGLWTEDVLERRKEEYRRGREKRRVLMQLLLESLGDGTDILDRPNRQGKTPRQIEQAVESEAERLEARDEGILTERLAKQKEACSGGERADAINS